MAEERIFIAKLGGRNCPVETNDNICLQGSYCEECNAGISLQEAIRKMCDVYFKAKDKGAMESERVVAALNALLDGKNEKENN